MSSEESLSATLHPLDSEGSVDGNYVGILSINYSLNPPVVCENDRSPLMHIFFRYAFADGIVLG